MKMLNELEDFDLLKVRRHEAMRTLDLTYARAVVPNTHDEILLVALHKARYETPEIEEDLRHASGDWLREHDYTRINGRPILPKGRLP